MSALFMLMAFGCNTNSGYCRPIKWCHVIFSHLSMLSNIVGSILSGGGSRNSSQITQELSHE